MEQVKTSVGIIDCPDLEDIGPRTKYWCEAIRDVIKTEEMYMVMGAALEEAYRTGVIGGLAHFMQGIEKMEEVVDAEFEVVEEGAAGPEPAEPAPADQSCGPLEPGPDNAELSGGVPEGSGS